MAVNPKRRRGALRPLRLWGLVLGLLVFLTGLPVVAAHADTDDDLLVELTSVTPTVLDASSELVITGRVTNRSGQQVSDLAAHLWRDATPITTIDALNAAQTGPQDSGEAMQSSQAVQVLGDDGSLQPGASADFTVRADLSPDAAEQLWLSQPGACYQIGVQIFSAQQAVGGASTLAPFPGDDQSEVGTVALLSATPTLLPLDSQTAEVPVFADDSLSDELSGRLDRLLTLAEQDDVWVVIDPLLYDEVTALAEPHSIREEDGTVSEPDSAGSATAQAWLDRVDALISSGRLTRTLYGSLDAGSVVTAGRSDLIGRAAGLPAGHALAGLPLAVVPYGGRLDEATAASLGQVSADYVFAADLGAGRVRYQTSGLDVLSIDAASAPGMQSDPVASLGASLARQLIGSHQGMPAIEIVSTDEQVNLALSDQSWLSRRPITELAAASGTPGDPSWPTDEQPVDAALVDAIDQSAPGLDSWTELTTDPNETPTASPQPDSVDAATAVLAGTWSQSWGRDTDAQVAWLNAAGQAAIELVGPDAVEVRASDWVTTSSEDNLLPVTVVNKTDAKLTVRVHFDSDNPLRIRVDDSELVTVDPGESATVRVSPIAQGNGTVAMRAQVVTSGGHPVGMPVSFSATSTEAGRVAWIIIVASGVVLLGATAYRVRSMMRRKGREDEG